MSYDGVDKREHKEQLDEIERLVQEIHQRQIERTIPAVIKIEKTLYGNGEEGLCSKVSGLQTTISVCKWVFGISFSVVLVVLAVFEFILKHVR